LRRGSGVSWRVPSRSGNGVRKRAVACFGRAGAEVVMSKSADKPKKQVKQKPQKTLKERRSEKRAAKKLGSSSLLRADE